jgi:hypothetical protein
MFSQTHRGQKITVAGVLRRDPKTPPPGGSVLQTIPVVLRYKEIGDIMWMKH